MDPNKAPLQYENQKEEVSRPGHEQREDTCWVRCIHQDRVDDARKSAVPEKELNRLADMYKVMGDPSRLKIIVALRQGEMCVCDIAAFLEITESAVSHQLRRLRDLAVVKNRRDGKILYYSLDDDHVSRLVALGLEHVRE